MLTYEIVDHYVKLKYNGIDIKCRWTCEAMDDVEAVQKLDMVATVTKMVNWEVFAMKSKDFAVNDPPDVLTEADKEKIKEIFKVSGELSEKRRKLIL